MTQLHEHAGRGVAAQWVKRGYSLVQHANDGRSNKRCRWRA